MYYAALAFHPAFGWNVVEREWVENAKKMVKSVWEDSYSRLEITHTSGEPVAKRRKTFHNTITQFKEDERQKAMTTITDGYLGDEYECWQLGTSETDVEVADPYEIILRIRFNGIGISGKRQTYSVKFVVMCLEPVGLGIMLIPPYQLGNNSNLVSGSLPNRAGLFRNGKLMRLLIT